MPAKIVTRIISVYKFFYLPAKDFSIFHLWLLYMGWEILRLIPSPISAPLFDTRQDRTVTNPTFIFNRIWEKGSMEGPAKCFIKRILKTKHFSVHLILNKKRTPFVIKNGIPFCRFIYTGYAAVLSPRSLSTSTLHSCLFFASSL